MASLRIYFHANIMSDIKDVRKDGHEKPTAENATMLTGKLIVTISIPFKGNSQLFACSPSTHSLNPPQGDIKGSEILLSYQVRDRNPDAIKKIYARDMEVIKSYLGFIKKDLDNHNLWIQEKTRTLIANRKKQLLIDLGFVESLDLPIKRVDKFHDDTLIEQVRERLTKID